MTTSHSTAQVGTATKRKMDGILPLAVRQRLWDQIWVWLLAPPAAPSDRSLTHTNTEAAPHEGRVR